MVHNQVRSQEYVPIPFYPDEDDFIFISYAHKDSKRVYDVITQLYEVGYHVWFDAGIPALKDWQRTIDEHIVHCRAFLLFSSEASHASKYVADEIKKAHENERHIIDVELNINVSDIIKSLENTGVPNFGEREAVSPTLEEQKVFRKLQKLMEMGGKYIPLDCDEIPFAFVDFMDEDRQMVESLLYSMLNSGFNVTRESGKIANASTHIQFISKATRDNPDVLQKIQETPDVLIVCADGCRLPDGLDDEMLKYQHVQRFDGAGQDKLKNLLHELDCHCGQERRLNSLDLPGFDNVVLDREGTDELDVVLLRYTGTDTNVIVANEFTEIGARAFYDCKSLISVEIPDSVTRIGTAAFEGCNFLRTITSPSFEGAPSKNGIILLKYTGKDEDVVILYGITEIGASAYEGCKFIKTITIPDSVMSIGDRAFAHCTSLALVILPNSITSIGNEAFNDTSLIFEAQTVNHEPKFHAPLSWVIPLLTLLVAILLATLHFTHIIDIPEIIRQIINIFQ